MWPLNNSVIYFLVVWFCFLRLHVVCDSAPCYLDFCWCVNTTAQCNNNGEHLRIVPKVTWANVTHYYFTYNYLPTITRNTFKNIKDYNITVLDLRGNGIETIAKSSFRFLTKLHTLYLSENGIPLKELQSSFISMPISLSYLYLSRMNLTNLPENFFWHLDHTMITGIHLSDNRITEFNTSVLRYTKHVTTLDIARNRISSLELSYVETLVSLWLGHNALNELPGLCDSGGPLFPQLWSLGLENNNVTSLDSTPFRCLKELRVLLLSRNNLVSIQSSIFSDMDTLQKVDISNNETPLRIYPYAFTNRFLQIVNLSRSVRFIDEHAFSGSPSVNAIDLSNNKFNTRQLGTLLSHLPLKIFVCRNCSLQDIPDMIKTMPRLEVLILDRNNLSVIPNHIFNINTKLKVLSLSNNNLHSVADFAITFSLRLSLHYLDLENNPFHCDCKLLWFKQWILEDKEMFHDQWTNYTCATSIQYKDQRLIDVGIVSSKVCLHAPYTTLFGTVGTVFIVILLGALFYKWRWSLRYCCMTRRSNTTFAEEASSLLQSDAYVVYCKDDYPWIRYQLMPSLEEKRSLKLVIKQRDFNHQLHLVDNIVDNLRHCRKALVILSNSCLKDSECQFELSLVQKKLEHQDGSLVVVLLENIEDRYRTSSLDGLVSLCTLFHWSDKPTQSAAFWTALQSSLRGVHLQEMV